MANKKETPKDYDRWGKVGITLISSPKNKTPKKIVKTVKKGK